MGYRGREILIPNMDGGQASNRPVTGLEINQALLLDNVHSLSGGGIELRQGDTEFNSVAMASGAAVTGLQFYKQADADTFLVAVAGSAIFKSDDLDGTMDTITGAVVVTSNKNNLWTSFTAGDEAIFVGGAPDPPFSFTGTGDAAILSGSAPSGRFGFFHNNRMFIGSTTAARSTIFHSTLTNIKDFSGDGSGNANVDGNDGDTLIGAAPLNTDVVLLFKQNSIHQYLTTTFPFPRFPLFKNVGAISKTGIVVHQGIAYFITPQARMKATDGRQIIDFPPDIDDVWDSLAKGRLEFIQGYIEEGKNFRHIKWIGSTDGVNNDIAIIWDLDKKTWWKYSTGHDINSVTHDTDNNVIYGGHYDGKIYKKNVTATFTDASESDAGIDGFWRWGWQINGSFQIPVNLNQINVGFESQTTGDLKIAYGFDFNTDTKSELRNMIGPGMIWNDNWDEKEWADTTDLVRRIKLFGRGNAFQLTFSNALVGNNFKINGFSVSGKQQAQKEFTAA